MARTNNLTNFLTDVSSAIKQKTGDSTPIPAANFDTEILNIETGGNYQNKSLEISQNGNYNLLPDTGYDAMSSVTITANVEPDLSNYFTSQISHGTSSSSGVINTIKSVPSTMTISTNDASYMFYRCYSLTSIPLLNTSNVINFQGMFQGCSALTSVPLLDTSKATLMGSMFYQCGSLTSVPLLNTANVTEMNYMFNQCTNLTSVPALNTGNVTNFYGMFNQCTNLTTVSQLDTSKATSMRYMFNSCPNLSNESLNNILAMCANATSYTDTKTLAYIGLSSAQATTCTGLSNYAAFTAAGWTTGY